MTDKDRHLMIQAAAALSDARRLWPARHPASGMIVGIEEDCQRVYQTLTKTLEALTVRLSEKSVSRDISRDLDLSDYTDIKGHN